MEEAVVGECQRAVHAWIEDGSQSREPGQGGGTVPADRQAANGAGVAQKNLSSCDACELRKLVDSNHPELSVSRQCEILGLPDPPIPIGPLQSGNRFWAPWPGSMRFTGRIPVVVAAGWCLLGQRRPFK